MPLIVETVTHEYLGLADEAAPGLVEGLYLIGSVPLNDFHSSVSDIDFVAVTRAPLDADALKILTRVHRGLAARHRRPGLDGIYATWEDLSRDPRTLPPGPRVHGARLVERSTAGRHPVAWQEVATHGLPLRGPARQAVDTWTDDAALRDYTLLNLDGYWRHWCRQRENVLSVQGLAALGSWAPAWVVLGVSRLRYALETGRITSKREAGQYARTNLDPRWRDIVDECLRIRLDQQHAGRAMTPWRRRREALAFVGAMIQEALGDT
ncbi:DUF4111 domain-containing protein [Frankia sp. AgB32]|nr:DUF4111 domain-containing protein [Frankia sp. AgB32]